MIEKNDKIDSSESRSLSDNLRSAIILANADVPATQDHGRQMADELINRATPEQLLIKRDKKNILDLAMDEGDEKHAVAIAKKCFHLFTPEEKIEYRNKARLDEASMPELSALMDQKLDPSYLNLMQSKFPKQYSDPKKSR